MRTLLQRIGNTYSYGCYRIQRTTWKLTTTRMYAIKSQLRTRGKKTKERRTDNMRLTHNKWERCCWLDDQAACTSQCQCSAIYTGGSLFNTKNYWDQAKRTGQLANALSQNCGNKIHKELASRSFTDALLRLAGDRVCYQRYFRARTHPVTSDVTRRIHTSK